MVLYLDGLEVVPLSSTWRYSPKIGLALGGGGARGGIHVGVLKALENHGIKVNCLAGTSVGALVGALYALTLNPRQIEQRLFDYLESQTFKKAPFHILKDACADAAIHLHTRLVAFIKRELLVALALSRPCLISKDQFREQLAFFLQDGYIDETRIPFAAVATDLENGEEVVIREGSLADAVYASCTYPGVVEPIRLQGRLLVDGGVIAQVPVRAARMLGAGVVVAVDAGCSCCERAGNISGVETLVRADMIREAKLTRYEVQNADALIHPRLGSGRWYDFRNVQDYITAGEQATREKVPEIRRVLKRRSLKRLFRSIRVPVGFCGFSRSIQSFQGER